MMMLEVQVSNREPSLTALRMPSGIEIKYVSSVIQMPSDIETGSFSLMSCSTLVSRKKLLPKSNVLKFQIIIRKRCQAGLSKPNCFSRLLINSGSRPCAPRYFELTSPPALGCPCPRAPKSPPCEPEMREVAPVSEPEICAITRSTGPPGANCTTTKDTNMIPSRVGIDRKSVV